jgi:hypothetical protein
VADTSKVLYAVRAGSASQSELAVSRHADGSLSSDMTIFSRSELNGA